MVDINDIDTLYSATAVDRDGDKLGKIGQVYVSDDGRQPLFVTVHTGLFGTKQSFVPLQGADLRGDTVTLQYDKDTIKGAPNIDDDGALSDDEQETLFDYYDGRSGGVPSGVGGAPAGLGSGTGTDTTAGIGTGTDIGTGTGTGTGYSGTDTTDRTTTGRPTVGHDTSGPTTDDAMTRSEERLNVGTEKAEVGRARLRKHVPVTHEEVRVEREPITDANRGDALSGPDLSEEEHEVVLTEERPVVEKETVPVERVRLEKEQVTENRQVTEDVRREEIETDDAAGTNRR
jgi:uncharacterized protein (TIGR02271 family)